MSKRSGCAEAGMCHAAGGEAKRRDSFDARAERAIADFGNPEELPLRDQFNPPAF
ncbi:MAG: hypothetical protein ACLGJB_07675 [Blastocatellia bacterium]